MTDPPSDPVPGREMEATTPLERARHELHAGRVVAALAACEAILREDPDHGEAMALRDECHAALERRKHRKATLAEALRLDAAGDLDGAIAACRAGLSADPDHAELRAFLDKLESASKEAATALASVLGAVDETTPSPEAAAAPERILADPWEPLPAAAPPTTPPSATGPAPPPAAQPARTPPAPPKPPVRHVRPIVIERPAPKNNLTVPFVGGGVFLLIGLLIATRSLWMPRPASEATPAPSAVAAPPSTSPASTQGAGGSVTPAETEASPAAHAVATGESIPLSSSTPTTSATPPERNREPIETPAPDAGPSQEEWAKQHDEEMARLEEDRRKRDNEEADRKRRIEEAERRVQDLRDQLNPYRTAMQTDPALNDPNRKMELEADLAKAEEDLRRAKEE